MYCFSLEVSKQLINHRNNCNAALHVSLKFTFSGFINYFHEGLDSKPNIITRLV